MSFGISSRLVRHALRDIAGLYYTPSELHGTKVNKNQLIRVGGVVVENSLHCDSSATEVQFLISDTHHTIKVHFHGVLPALFDVGQPIEAQGYLQKDGVFRANQVVAKQVEDCCTV